VRGADVQTQRSRQPAAPLRPGEVGSRPDGLPTPSDTLRWRLLGALPDALVAGLAGFTISAVALLLLGAFRSVPVLVLGGAAGLTLARVAVAPLQVLPRGERAPTLLAVALCMLAAVVNAALSAEYLFVARDPAIYTAAARWLMDHPSLVIDAQAGVFGADPRLDPASPGFEAAPGGRIAVQGLPALPALLAVGGWVAGVDGLLRVNAVVGAVAALAVFGLVRRIAGGWAALGAMSVLLVSLPFLAFTRAAYTEPLTALFLIGGLGVLWRAIEERRPPRTLAAGAVLGSAVLVRVDGHLALVGLVVVAAVMIGAHPRVDGSAAARRQVSWRQGSRCAAALLSPVVLLGALALATLSRFGRTYLQLIRPELLTLGAGTVVVAACCTAALVTLRACPAARQVLLRHRRALGATGAAGVLLGFAVLATRPLWLISRHNAPTGFQRLGELQARLGLAVDPQRSYEEATLNWLAAYYGWPVVASGAIGLAWLTHRAIARPHLRLLPVVLMVLTVATVYLNRTGIFPDHIWAVRRFVPVVVPGLLLGTAVCLARLARIGRVGAVGAAAAWLGIVVSTAAVSAPLAGEAEHVGELRQIRTVCARLGPDAALLLDGGYPNLGYVQPVRSFCGVPVQTAPQLTPDLLARAQQAAAADGRTLHVGAVVGAFGTADRADSLTLVSALRTQLWEERFGAAPRAVVEHVRSVYLARVTPDGTLAPLR
jgi:hypothetical protein